MKAVSNAYESCSVPGILEIPGGFKSKVTGLTLKLCRAYAAYKRSCWTLTSHYLRMRISLFTYPAAVPASSCSKRSKCLWRQCNSVIIEMSCCYADAKIKIKVAVPNPVRPFLWLALLLCGL